MKFAKNMYICESNCIMPDSTIMLETKPIVYYHIINQNFAYD